MKSKVRLWDTVEKKFIAFERIEGRTPDEFLYSNYLLGMDGKVYIKNGKDYFIEAKNILVQAWTGKTDKNGKDIFQGDICHKRGYGTNGIIVWDNEYSCFEFHSGKGTGGGKISENVFGNTLEVIGNVFESNGLTWGYVNKEVWSNEIADLSNSPSASSNKFSEDLICV